MLGIAVPLLFLLQSADASLNFVKHHITVETNCPQGRVEWDDAKVQPDIADRRFTCSGNTIDLRRLSYSSPPPRELTGAFTTGRSGFVLHTPLRLALLAEQRAELPREVQGSMAFYFLDNLTGRSTVNSGLSGSDSSMDFLTHDVSYLPLRAGGGAGEYVLRHEYRGELAQNGGPKLTLRAIVDAVYRSSVPAPKDAPPAVVATPGGRVVIDIGGAPQTVDAGDRVRLDLPVNGRATVRANCDAPSPRRSEFQITNKTEGFQRQMNVNAAADPFLHRPSFDARTYVYLRCLPGGGPDAQVLDIELVHGAVEIESLEAQLPGRVRDARVIAQPEGQARFMFLSFAQISGSTVLAVAGRINAIHTQGLHPTKALVPGQAFSADDMRWDR